MPVPAAVLGGAGVRSHRRLRWGTSLRSWLLFVVHNTSVCYTHTHTVGCKPQACQQWRTSACGTEPGNGVLLGSVVTLPAGVSDAVWMAPLQHGSVIKMQEIDSDY